MSEDDRERLATELKRAMRFLNEKRPRRVRIDPPTRAVPPASAMARSSSPGKSISFTPALLEAVLTGHKTQTRRPIRPAPITIESGVALAENGEAIAPIYLPADRLWLREKWARPGKDPDSGFVYARDQHAGVRWRSSRFMPAAAARTFLRVQRVTPARLMSISPSDAKREGIRDLQDPIASFIELWDSIYGQGEFAARNDPWVWVIEFSVE